MRKNFMFTIFRYFLILFLLASCIHDKNSNSYDEITAYFDEKFKYKVKGNIKAIFVLTERNCMSCNKMFSDFMVQNQNKEQAIYLIKAIGTSIDISPYDNMKGNVFYSYEDDNMKLFNASKVIFLNQKSIDTIITINAKSINKDLDFINHKLKM